MSRQALCGVPLTNGDLPGDGAFDAGLWTPRPRRVLSRAVLSQRAHHGGGSLAFLGALATTSRAAISRKLMFWLHRWNESVTSRKSGRPGRRWTVFSE